MALSRPDASLTNANFTIPAISHTTINGGSFVEARKYINIQSGNPYQRGLDILREKISPGAFHDATERGDPPKCHPKTRTAVLDELMTWITSPIGHRKLILWLYGPAGAGKTAIAQTFAETCVNEDILAACFFFFRSAVGRNTSSHIIATISYQLAMVIPGLRDTIGKAVEKDPTVFNRALATQMQELILKPYQEALRSGGIPQTNTKIPRLVILDGLDECSKESEQQDILDVLVTFSTQLNCLPLYFLISSRPEYTIRTAFNRNAMLSLHSTIALDDNYLPDRDIALFLKESFERIKDTHPSGRDSFPALWPTLEQLTYLVEKASGQFIFAATVMKYVDYPRDVPSKRLRAVLNISASGDNAPFSQLDSLYRHILSSVSDLPKVLDILALILFNTPDGSGSFETEDSMNVLALYDHLLQLEVGETRTLLLDMHALMAIPPIGDKHSQIRIYHASLQDFLMDQSRSKEFFINPQMAHIKLATLTLQNVLNGPAFGSLPHHAQHFVFHCKKILNSEAKLVIPDAWSKAQIQESMLNKFGFYLTDWTGFFSSLDKMELLDLKRSIQTQVRGWLFSQMRQYPEPLLSFAPTVCCLPSHEIIVDIFEILLRGSTLPASWYKDFYDLDQNLMGFFEPLFYVNPRDGISVMGELLEGSTSVGTDCIDGNSYLQLTWKLIESLSLISMRLEVVTFMNRFEMISSRNDIDPNATIRLTLIDMDYFAVLFDKSSSNTEFAALVQSKLDHWEEEDTFLTETARANLVKFSEGYIARCRDDTLASLEAAPSQSLDSSPGPDLLVDSDGEKQAEASQSKRKKKWNFKNAFRLNRD